MPSMRTPSEVSYEDGVDHFADFDGTHTPQEDGESCESFENGPPYTTSKNKNNHIGQGVNQSEQQHQAGNRISDQRNWIRRIWVWLKKIADACLARTFGLVLHRGGG
ncbi:hypothetical protein COCC4DRAFT_43877 [Bipolaris maydis ATCC 48331]|uniref:Uncharacterized protein n=2 Tax=Cochliobolus heterostrophus TaxID=5016 RepID=M2V912_COCH5|nr:uncharacterized protein COCC4DRAFT_43877 [Bipolaris maydis ATCC 48331]EMD96457.1 hypothetical protein COCHEDRAFT_1086290 [Bipolaris maydis C5]ENI01017.1 hypothetical protein COCC4DRAFT_43877 [Bipolaris maydis ATCC 48331]